jgi:hypothetical protein
MGNMIVCAGDVVLAPPQPTGPTQAAYWVNETYQTVPMPVCLTGWEIKPEPSTDFQGLIDLLTFNPEICAQLIGVCLVIFIIGYSGGKVSRILSRR